MTTPRCTGPLCDRPVVSRGLCDAHRQQRRNHPGKPLEALPSGPRMTDEQAANLRTAYLYGRSVKALARAYRLPMRAIRATLVGELNPHADVPPVALRNTGGAASREVTQARIEDALWLLDAGEWPVAVAERVGYPTLHAMTRAFRRAGVPVPAATSREEALLRRAAA